MENLANKRQKTIIFSRVVGWLTPIHSFNLGKAEEYKDRKVYDYQVSLDHEFLV